MLKLVHVSDLANPIKPTIYRASVEWKLRQNLSFLYNILFYSDTVLKIAAV